jgi:hypothetical protein
MRDYSFSQKSSMPTNILDTSFVRKIKEINQKNHFICELSDQKGLPLWQYAYKVENSIQNKGHGEEEDFIIIPMQFEEDLYLTSLLYIKNPDSESPDIYTITNNELLSFVENNSIEKHERESLLMTFLYFDHKIFGEDRKYTKIPLDLFESIPEFGMPLDGHEHTHESGTDEENFEGFGYKQFSFTINDKEAKAVERAFFCVTYNHCPGFYPQCFPDCDGCYTYCASVVCYSVGGGGGSGNYGGGSGGSGNSGGGGGTGGNDAPWYTHYPNYENYHPKLRILLERLNQFGVKLDDHDNREIEYLNTRAHIISHNLNTYLVPNTLEKSKFIRDVAVFLSQNKNDIVQPEKILERIQALEQYLYDNPYAISNIPCEQIPLWQEVVQHQVPQSVKNKLQNLDDTQSSPYYGWALQNIENADGSLVNNDYFSVTFNTMPYKPFPHQNQQFTPEEFLYYVRTNLDSFVNTNYSSFAPSNQTGYNEGAIWYSNNPMEAIVHINIPGDDGSVITSGYNNNYDIFGGFQNGHWIFTTIKTPYASLTQGLDGEHPVSGHRKFGLIKSGSSYTIYTRGVDRVTGGLGAKLVGQQYMFTQADNLWTSFQQGIKSYIQYNSYGNTVTINTPAKWRPKWQEAKNVLIKNLPPSSLDECN